MGKMEKYSYEAGVYIGRFQPFHNGHLNSIKSALLQSKILILVLGGAHLSPSIRGPWSVEERVQMIKSCLTKQQLKRIYFVYVRDRLYCEEKWIQNVKGEVAKIIGNENSVAIIGHEKDSSSYYLKVFPEWHFFETGNFKKINATDVRKSFFLSKNLKSAYEKIPIKIANWLKNYRKTNSFKVIRDKFIYVDKSLKSSNVKLETEVFNLFLFCNGYILLVKSNKALQKNLYSLPEPDFFDHKELCNMLMNEIIFQELTEKIKFKVIANHVFDYPERFPIGKQHSNTYYLKLNESHLPKVTSGKNTKLAEWVLLEDVYLLENQIYSDHYQIIQWFLNSSF